MLVCSPLSPFHSAWVPPARRVGFPTSINLVQENSQRTAIGQPNPLPGNSSPGDSNPSKLTTKNNHHILHRPTVTHPRVTQAHTTNMGAGSSLV